jgi:DNA-binding NarL/FixJ family response regulator
MPLRVLLVERSALIRAACRRLLQEDADLSVVAEASNTPEAVATLARQDVDVVVICATADKEAISGSAIAALRLAADVRIVCVAHWTDPRDVDATLNAGALGCVGLYDASDADLKRAVHLVHRGERYLSPGLSSASDPVQSGWEAGYERLTAREKEVLLRIAQSKSNREIARELNLSMNTVAVHRNKMMKKIGVRKATALAVFAAERGLLMRK